MADEKKPDAEAEEPKAGRSRQGQESGEQRSAGGQKFSRERVLDDALALTGHERYVVAGALAASDRDEFTREEVSGLVDEFLRREVSTGAPGEEAS